MGNTVETIEKIADTIEEAAPVVAEVVPSAAPAAEQLSQIIADGKQALAVAQQHGPTVEHAPELLSGFAKLISDLEGLFHFHFGHK